MCEELLEEARYLHRLLFGSEASDTFLDRYLAAHAALPALGAGQVDEQRTVRIVVEQRLNALAVECALRRPRGRHLLSQKLLLANYIAECDGEHTAAFCLSGARIVNLGIGIIMGLTGIRQHLVGRFLVQRHALV